MEILERPRTDLEVRVTTVIRDLKLTRTNGTKPLEPHYVGSCPHCKTGTFTVTISVPAGRVFFSCWTCGKTLKRNKWGKLVESKRPYTDYHEDLNPKWLAIQPGDFVRNGRYVFPGETRQTKVGSLQETILTALGTVGATTGMKIQEVAKSRGMSQATAKRAIAGLVAEGKLVKYDQERREDGTLGPVRYALAEPVLAEPVGSGREARG